MELRWRSPGSSPERDIQSEEDANDQTGVRVKITDIRSASEEEDGESSVSDSGTGLVERTSVETASREVTRSKDNEKEYGERRSVISRGRVLGYFRDLSLTSGRQAGTHGPRRPMCEPNPALAMSPPVMSTAHYPVSGMCGVSIPAQAEFRHWFNISVPGYHPGSSRRNMHGEMTSNPAIHGPPGLPQRGDGMNVQPLAPNVRGDQRKFRPPAATYGRQESETDRLAIELWSIIDNPCVLGPVHPERTFSPATVVFGQERS